MRGTLLLDPVGRPGWHNMAIDQALLDLAVGEGRLFLRMYRWEPCCLSFGLNEPALKRYDRGAIEHRGLDTVRRPTGGRAVWHAEELTYAVAGPIETFGTLAETYRCIHETIAEALRSLGLPAALASPPARSRALDAGACFASPAGGEVVVGAGKVVGSAQLRQGSAFLQHGSIILDGSQQVVSEVTLGAPPMDGSVALSAVRGGLVTFEEVARALGDSARSWKVDCQLGDPSSPQILAAAAPHAARFKDPAWTWRR